MEKECIKHGLTKYTLRGKSFRCNKCCVEHITKRRRVLKIKAVEYKGGKCFSCGYNKCVDALDFHHVDKTLKDFTIGAGSTKGWETVKRELDKCIILCANCHRELHAKENIPL